MPRLTPAQLLLDIRCASCIFFSPSPLVQNRGQCRRHPPILDLGDENRPRSVWPMVNIDGFCGEHSTLEEIADAQ